MSQQQLFSFPESETLYPPRPDTSRLLVGCPRGEYSASRLCMAVEDCNAHVLNLNVTAQGEVADDYMVVDMRVDHRSVAPIQRSLERYGYEVLLVRSDSSEDSEAEDYNDTLRRRIQELLRYIEL